MALRLHAVADLEVPSHLRFDASTASIVPITHPKISGTISFAQWWVLDLTLETLPGELSFGRPRVAIHEDLDAVHSGYPMFAAGASLVCEGPASRLAF